ncbi:TIGR04211 family SH3 domain-containing protein [bacterium]|jgi:SH3 domain protein|nr:TIGR04211 family SH3 domain-containing protein [Pseudomonadales bacterium]MDB4452833.1 TIGR04211 family SH3 domain-containing protein [bacterium]
MLTKHRVTRILFFLLVSGSFFSTSLHAESQGYVADVFYVPLHSGASTKHRIVHRGLKTGTSLTILQTDDKAGFTQVRTQSGIEGWIQNQFISNTPIARTLLKQAQQQRSELQSQLSSISATNESVSTAHEEAQKRLKSLSRQNQSLTGELASIKKISSNAINLDINNRDLLQKSEMLKVEIAELQAENARLSDKSNKDWFVRGALAVAIGALLAVILPRFKPKIRSSEWG